MRELSAVDQEIDGKIRELQLLVADRLRKCQNMPDIKRMQSLVDDIQLIRHIFVKDEGSI